MHDLAKCISSFIVLRQPDGVYLLPKGVIGEYLYFITAHSSLPFQCHAAVHHTIREWGLSNICQPGSLKEFGWQNESMDCVCGIQVVMALSKLICQHRAWYTLPWTHTVCLLDITAVEDSTDTALASQLSCASSSPQKAIKLKEPNVFYVHQQYISYKCSLLPV